MNNKTIHQLSNNWLRMLKDKEMKKEAAGQNTLNFTNSESEIEQKITEFAPSVFALPNVGFQIFPALS